MKTESAPTKSVETAQAEASVDLPHEAMQALADAYREYNEAVKKRSPGDRKAAATHLANLAATGRNAGWSVRALADPCGITPERLRQIVKGWADGTPVDVTFPPHPSPRSTSPRQRNARVHLTKEEARELRELAPVAAANSGSCKLGTKPRIASERFSDLIKKHHLRGVTWQELSDATRPWKEWPLSEKTLKSIQRALARGKEDPLAPTHHPSGIRMRAARHGYGRGAPPSVKPYQGVFIHDKNDGQQNAEGGQGTVSTTAS